MYINVNPFDSDVAELEQSDIESMWNYLMEEPDNFIYTATQYIIGLELDYYKDELESLYKALKPLYDE